MQNERPVEGRLQDRSHISRGSTGTAISSVHDKEQFSGVNQTVNIQLMPSFSAVSTLSPESNHVVDIGQGGRDPLQVRESSPYPPGSSPTSAFLLGLHKYATHSSDLPEFVRDHHATLTFPEKLMLMLTYVDREYATDCGKEIEHATVSWTMDGRAFIIRSKDDLVKELLPMFFREGKFASFTRKLYRWGFRQVTVSPDRIHRKREIIFGHDLFRKDNKTLMGRMRSVTAAATRRALTSSKQKYQFQSGHRSGIGNMIGPPTGPTQLTELQPSPAFTVSPGDIAGSYAQGPSPFSVTLNVDNDTRNDRHQRMSNVIDRLTHKNGTPSLQNAFITNQQQNIRNTESSHYHQARIMSANDNTYFNSLAQLGVQGTFQDLRGQTPNGTDPHSFMLAAIDMLLRHASNSASSNMRNDYK